MSDDQTFDEIIAASARRLQHPPPGPHPGDEFGSYKDEKGLRLTIERLTTELAEMTKDRDDWMACQEKSLGRLWVMQENYEAMKAAAEAREKALRAITGDIVDAAFSLCRIETCKEWDRRASEIV